MRDAFSDEGNQSKENKARQSLAPVATLWTPSTLSDGGEEHANDDIMTNIKDNMIGLLREY